MIFKKHFCSITPALPVKGEGIFKEISKISFPSPQAGEG
jgi:hypothetical protein